MKIFVYLFLVAMLVALGLNIYYFDSKFAWDSTENSLYVLGGLSSLIALLGSVLWLSLFNLNKKIKTQ